MLIQVGQTARVDSELPQIHLGIMGLTGNSQREWLGCKWVLGVGLAYLALNQTALVEDGVDHSVDVLWTF